MYEHEFGEGEDWDDSLVASCLLIAYERQIKLLNVRLTIFEKILRNLKEDNKKQ